MTSRFDYVKYDEIALRKQDNFKKKMVEIEGAILDNLSASEYRKKAIESLEIAYAWLGKAVRDEQVIVRSTQELQEERSNG